MKKRKQRRIIRRITRDYEGIAPGNLPELPLILPPPIKPGEMFQKFTLYDKNRSTYTDIKTEYIV